MCSAALFCRSVLTAAALVIFLVTFFVVNYPEIRRSRFDAANMTVDEIDIASRYCCERSCDDTCSNSFFGTRCDAMQNAAQALDPTKCTANSTNAALCPLSGPAATCDNGDYCCATCCSTCQSCTTSCSGTGSSQSCTTSCSSYECNCYCCSETAHQQCTMQCNLCYAVEMHVEFNDRWRRKTTAELSMDFKRDLNAAQVFFNAHLPNSTFVGYYDTHDTSVILLSRDFTVKPWIGLASATLPLFLAVLINTAWVIDVSIDRVKWLRWELRLTRSIAPSIPVAASSAIWLGLLIPLAVLVPVEQLGYITPAGRTALTVCIPIVLVVGWIPLAIHGWRRFQLFRTTTAAARPPPPATYEECSTDQLPAYSKA